MQVFEFCINGTHGRIHALRREYVVPMLRHQGLLKPEDLLQVDFKRNGNMDVVWHRPVHIICPFCQTSNGIGKDDLGFEEYECTYCESTIAIPETLEEIPQFNKESMAAREEYHPTHYRIMGRGEDGMEFCLKNGVPEEYAQLVCDGFQAGYHEGQTCWIEPEETLADLRRMCDYED
jgi:hypothetical protein